MQAEVIAVGKGKVGKNGKTIAPDVKTGNRILFSKYAGTEVKIEGKEHLIIREDDILGIIEAEESERRQLRWQRRYDLMT
jgi:chaperonin GroES